MFKAVPQHQFRVVTPRNKEDVPAALGCPPCGQAPNEPSFHVALYQPEIPWNTGNIGRTCVAVGAALHLIGRLGFDLSDKEIRRSGLDYWPQLMLFQHDDFPAFEKARAPGAPLLAFSTKAARSFWEANYAPGAYLLFGSESRGLPPDLLKRCEGRLYRIPTPGEVRSLNLSTAAAVVLYEALRARYEISDTLRKPAVETISRREEEAGR